MAFPDCQKSFLPRVIYIVLNHRCNLRCKTCDIGTGSTNSSFYAKLHSTDKDFDAGRLKRFVEEVAYFNPLIAFTSTEPLLYRRLFEICRTIKENRLQVSITTNGYLLRKFAENLIEMDIDYLTLSVDGTREVHNALRGRDDAYDKAIAGLQALEEIKRNRRKQSPLVFINYTISDVNFHNLFAFMTELQAYDIAMVSFSHLNFVTRNLADKHNQAFGHIGISRPSCISNVQLDRIDSEVLADQIRKVKRVFPDKPMLFVPDLKTASDIRDYYTNHFRNLGNKTCYVPWKYAQILANGDVTVLTRCFDVVFGNIFDEPFEQIWNGPKMKHFRKALKTHGLFPACLRCCGIF